MPSIFEVRDVNAFIWFAVWVLAITAATKAVFRSFLAAELTWWLRARSESRDRRINQLNWEVHHRARYDPDATYGRGTAGSARAMTDSLSNDKVNGKRAELLKLARGTVGQRLLDWFLGCTACQSFWLALAVYLAVRGVDGVISPVASALAYSCSNVVVAGFLSASGGPQATDAQRNVQPRPPSCAGCGR